MKGQYGLGRNFLKGEKGDVVNAILAGAAFNFKRWLNCKLEEISGFVQKWFLFGDPPHYKTIIL